MLVTVVSFKKPGQGNHGDNNLGDLRPEIAFMFALKQPFQVNDEVGHWMDMSSLGNNECNHPRDTLTCFHGYPHGCPDGCSQASL